MQNVSDLVAEFSEMSVSDTVKVVNKVRNKLLDKLIGKLPLEFKRTFDGYFELAHGMATIGRHTIMIFPDVQVDMTRRKRKRLMVEGKKRFISVIRAWEEFGIRAKMSLFKMSGDKKGHIVINFYA